ncbi:acetyl-CoA carboxylase biotin carboxylase subunit [Vulgatibacter sp.]|uniref:acetyl-CoA carboxylase biotin carboxylase subunit n=1 Tax=Vulgatibacter sp. TaxID=1971226 RepID=UPI0035650908
MFRKILVANRGEIAVRVMRTCREMGIRTVAVYSDADRGALHVRTADEAVRLGPAPSRESYLRIDKILEAAKATGAEAIHPGYGFLSERAEFVRECQKAGIVFIGPPAEAMDAMGEKTQARRRMIEAGVPVVPGMAEPENDIGKARAFAENVGFPVMIKAAAGGGGKGMRRVDSLQEFEAAFGGAQREAANAFGDDRVYIEKFLEKPRHVEIQIFADSHGNAVHLFERECSVQRRHQKVIEETPSPIVDEQMRREMGEVAVRAAKAVNYLGAGTCEFLVDAHRNFYFLEMNTRLQVEHPVTELRTGLDLVKWQLEVAAGGKLPLAQDEIPSSGHAIEARINAEDPNKNFMPSPGKITYMRLPGGPGTRIDGGVYPGYTVPMTYDSMIAKLIVWAPTRDEAIDRLKRALSDYVVKGITTNIGYLRQIIEHPEFRSGDYDTTFLARRAEELKSEPSEQMAKVALMASAIHQFQLDQARSRKLQDRAQGAQASHSRWAEMGRMRALGRGGVR